MGKYRTKTEKAIMKESSEHCIFIYVEKHQVTTFVLPVSILSVHLLPLHVTLSLF